MALFSIGMVDIRIANIDHPDVRQIGHVIFMVVSAGVAKGKQGRSLADRTRAKAGSGAPLRTHVVGRTHHRHIGVFALV